MKAIREHVESVDRKVDKIDIKIDDSFRSLSEEIKEELSCFVRKEEFLPVKNIAYGMVGAILVAFIGAVITLVMK